MSERGLILDLPLKGTIGPRPLLNRLYYASGTVTPSPLFATFAASNFYLLAADITGLPVGNVPFAVELEFNTTQTPGVLGGLVSWGNSDATGVLLAIANDGKLRFTASSVTQYSAVAKNDGKWHHVLATYDGINNALYVDGVLEDQDAATGNLQSSNFYIGAPKWFTTYTYTGKLRNVRIWNIPRFACHARMGANKLLRDKSNV